MYFTRLKSIRSIRKLTDYENYNLYRMDIDYAYDLDRLIDRGITDNQSMIDAILAEALPYLPIHMKATASIRRSGTTSVRPKLSVISQI